jgi:hypothetical protein
LKNSWDLSAGIFISMILQTPQKIKNQKPNQSKSIRMRKKEAGPHSLTHSHDDDTNLTSFCFLFFLIVVVSIQKIFFQIFNFFFFGYVAGFIKKGKIRKPPQKKKQKQTNKQTKKCNHVRLLSAFNFQLFFFGRGDGDGVFLMIMIKMMKCSNAQEEENKL